MTETLSPVDILAIGAHPDDVEMECGGSLLKWKAAGYSHGILDLTLGEAGTRGTIETRLAESQTAAAILQSKWRSNMELPDGGIENSESARLKLIRVLRQAQPKMILSPNRGDRHRDHRHAVDLIYDAWFLCGLRKIDPTSWTEGYSRANRLCYYVAVAPVAPTVIIDVGAYREQKLKAVSCYQSQFHQPGSTAPESRLSHPKFLEGMDARFRYWGTLINAEYGEGFLTEGPISPQGIDW